MITFEELGKKIDDLVKELSNRAKPLVEICEEIRDVVKQSLKTADRRGFERAIKLSSLEAERYGDHHGPNDEIASAISKIEYTEE